MPKAVEKNVPRPAVLSSLRRRRVQAPAPEEIESLEEASDLELAADAVLAKDTEPLDTPTVVILSVPDCLGDPVMLASPAAKAMAHLAQCDPVLAEVIRHVGPPPTSFRSPRVLNAFHALAQSIIYQQLAGSAAAAILNRFLRLFPDGDSGSFPTPAQVISEPLERLRSAGLSGRKASYITGLAAMVEDGTLPLELHEYANLDDLQVSACVVKVKGIGQWTADMFLIFTLERPDVLPVGDLGVRQAMQRLYRMSALPAPDHMLRTSETWRPYRSVAAWYLWRSGGVVTL